MEASGVAHLRRVSKAVPRTQALLVHDRKSMQAERLRGEILPRAGRGGEQGSESEQPIWSEAHAPNCARIGARQQGSTLAELPRELAVPIGSLT